MKVRELLTDESKWCQRHYMIRKGKSRQYCLAAAIDTCYPTEQATAVSLVVFDALEDKSQHPWRSISRWNDAGDRTFAEVKALVDELDI